MSNAKRDQNSVPTLLAVSNVDGVSPVPVYADPVTHRLLVDGTGLAGTFTYYVAATSGGSPTVKLTFVNGILTANS